LNLRRPAADFPRRSRRTGAFHLPRRYRGPPRGAVAVRRRGCVGRPL